MAGESYFKTYWFRSAGLAVLILLAAAAQSMAVEERSAWTIAYVGGAARTGSGNGVWWSIRLGEQVPPGNHIQTGSDGQVTLVRGGDSIEVAPDSEFSMSYQLESGEDGIAQTLGRLLFRMESRESRDFTIETPFLAAAIKGTTFTVTVSRGQAVVAVEEGSVEVTGGTTGEVALVGAGGRVSASWGSDLQIGSGGTEESTETGPSDKADPDGSDSVDPGGSDKADPDGSDGVDPGGSDKADPGGSDNDNDNDNDKGKGSNGSSSNGGASKKAK